MDPQGLAPSSLPGFKANRLEACEHLRCGRVLVFEGTRFLWLERETKTKAKILGVPQRHTHVHEHYEQRLLTPRGRTECFPVIVTTWQGAGF